jgi:hypothetical protein
MRIGDEMEWMYTFYTVQSSGITNRRVYVWPKLLEFLASPFLEKIFYCCSRQNEITKRNQGFAYRTTAHPKFDQCCGSASIFPDSSPHLKLMDPDPDPC